jgi:hypothetical protein
MQFVFASVLDQPVNQGEVKLPFPGLYQFPVHRHENGIEIQGSKLGPNGSHVFDV